MRSTAQSPFGGGSCWTFHKTTEAQSVHKSQLCWKCKSQKWHIPSRWPQTSWERTEKSILLSPKGKKVSNYTFLNLLPPPPKERALDWELKSLNSHPGSALACMTLTTSRLRDSRFLHLYVTECLGWDGTSKFVKFCVFFWSLQVNVYFYCSYLSVIFNINCLHGGGSHNGFF